MFYSQFILAKKGPLGTIWIAAHLERKLRKNQVADTDIGVSVDSILFPDVPIALRLSSHLLLGVVRIYSRKVNYLFDDCSEALLKIKQAFRSTAVDLPPEESTAPYHSITLPETFDLDDFELPDYDLFQGNNVDHHISSREQITLQDTMEGVVYTTSQFGLDERFGDGETSGLNLDENLLLDKVSGAGDGSILSSLGTDPQTSVHPMASLKLDENHEELMLDQIEGADGDTDFIEDAHAPCTPGLVEEPNLSSIPETSACEDCLESEDHNLAEVAARDSLENNSSKVGHQNSELLNGLFPVDVQPERVLCPVEGVTDKQNIRLSLDQTCSSSHEVGTFSLEFEPSNTVSGPSEVAVGDKEMRSRTGKSDELAVCSINESNESAGRAGNRLEDNSTAYQSVTGDASENDLIPHNLDESCTLNYKLKSNSELCDKNDLGNPQNCTHEPNDSTNPEHSAVEQVLGNEIHIPYPCSTRSNSHPGGGNSDQTELQSEVNAPNSLERSQKDEVANTSGISTVVKGLRDENAVNDSLQVLEESCIAEPASFEVLQVVGSKTNDQVENVVPADSCLENVNSSADSEVPASERLLSVPEGATDLPSDLLVEGTPTKGLSLEGEVDGDGSKFISGKKRSFTESTLTVQSMDSVESLGVIWSKQTTESVPGDDDLLSSILVGRRSSVLKVKPSPPLEITSVKRPRYTRPSASKRKVLMDETMVLHGDTIRQQLMSSEDIRRVRKKAPCTRPEVSMLQKQFLEDEIFNEPIFMGLSSKLMFLHKQNYDLREIMISHNDLNSTSAETAAEIKTSLEDSQTVIVEEDDAKELFEVPNYGIVSEEVEKDVPLMATQNGGWHVESPFPTENLVEGDQAFCLITCTQLRAKPTGDEVADMTPCHELLREITEMEIDGGCKSSANATSPPVESLNPIDGVLYSADDLPSDMVQLTNFDMTGVADSSLRMDAPVMSPNQKLMFLHSEINGSLIDTNFGNNTINENADKKDNVTAVGSVSRTGGELLLERNISAASIDIKEGIHLDTHGHTSSDPLIFSPEACECSTPVVASNQTIEESRKIEERVVSYDEFLNAEADCNAKNSIANGACGEGHAEPLGASVDADSILLNGLQTPGWQEAHPFGVRDAGFCSIDRVDPDDFDYSEVGHDTEFLNVDDDEVAEIEDDCVPHSAETGIFDNCGWSSRTRAVAKYLQVVFDKEGERGRNVLPMDNLLVGKTRKEASRMFFEALVLKTKDYIHVEQERPFGNINMMPRGKLMKSDY